MNTALITASIFAMLAGLLHVLAAPSSYGAA